MSDCITQIRESFELTSQADLELKAMAAEEVNQLTKEYLTTDASLKRNAFLEIRAGTGGDEAELFASELARMYERFAENQGFRLSLVRQNRSSIGGVKEIIYHITGNGAYGFLLPEGGVHRVQRVPETEKSGRVHTSAVSVVVLPEVPERELTINPKDLRVDVFHAQGHGGQGVNTTDSAVRITHLPTGLIVICQDERSQIKNRAKALAELRSRLFKIDSEKKSQELGQTRMSMIKSGDRSDKIKTYNFPQDRLTDHRMKKNYSQLNKILNGDLFDIILAYWVWNLTNDIES